MHILELKKLIARGESNQLEFKKTTTQLKAAAETLCGYLNCSPEGGIVLIGVANNGKVIGLDVSDQTLQEIARTLQRLEPTADVETQYIALDEGSKKKVLYLKATPMSSSVPYIFDGRPYLRLESSTSVMPQEHYNQLLQTRLDAQQTWEELPAKGMSFSDLDHVEILKTVQLGVGAGRITSLDAIADPKQALIGSKLMLGEHITNGAVVLYAKKINIYYAQCRARLARFKGMTKNEFIDNRQIEGNAFVLYEEILKFIHSNLPIASKFAPGKSERIDEPYFPIEAIREAVVNALIHRDYREKAGAVSVAMYDDRMEIWSDGTLPYGVHLDQLKKVHTSKPRNRNIANVFYRRKLCEEWGRGTIKIFEQCAELGYPEPEFFEQMGAFCVRLWSKVALKNHKEELMDISPRQQEILKIVAKLQNGSIKAILAELSQPCSERTLSRDLKALKELKLINMKGRSQSTVWVLNEDK